MSDTTPATAPKAKKPIFKKWWFWAIIVVVVIAIAGNGGNKKTTTVTEPAEQTQETQDAESGAADDATQSIGVEEPAEEENATEPEEVDTSNLSIGSSVNFEDGLSVTVNSVEAGLVNYDGSLITCVNVTYQNNGNDEADFNPYDWEGQDAQGVQRNTSYYSEASDELGYGSLAAGGAVTGNIYFDGELAKVVFSTYGKGLKKLEAAWVVA